jgi:hypothetical protein
MKITDNNIEVTYQEAWISTLFLSVEFTLNGVKLQATCIYYNDCRLEDIEVTIIDQPDSYFRDIDEEYEIGRQLLEDMDYNKYSTF